MTMVSVGFHSHNLDIFFTDLLNQLFEAQVYLFIKKYLSTVSRTKYKVIVEKTYSCLDSTKILHTQYYIITNIRSQCLHAQLENKKEREIDRCRLTTPRKGMPHAELTIIPPPQNSNNLARGTSIPSAILSPLCL